MSGVVGFCKIVRTLCEASSIVDGVDKVLSAQGNDERNINIASVATQVVALGINCVEGGAQIYGASNRTLQHIKSVEVAARGIHVPAKIMEGLVDHAQRGEEPSWRFLEKNVLSPTLSFLRATNEQSIYANKNYLEMSQEEFNKQEAPIYDNEGNIIGWKPLTRKECENGLELSTEIEPALNVAECVLKTEIISRNVGNLKDAYGRLAARLRGPIPAPAPIAPVAPHPLAAGPAQAAAVANNPFDLVALPSIPPELADDSIFSRYVCPITQEPIRHPVGLPGEPHLYEQSALVRWVTARGTSPTNRQRVGVHQIVAKRAIQALIDHRLQFHQQRLILHAQQGFVIPAEPNLVAAAQTEER